MVRLSDSQNQLSSSPNSAPTIPIRNILVQLNEHHSALFSKKIRDMNLKLEGSPLEGFVKKLHKELEDKGLSFRPACYLSDEWGCPHGSPAIGIPFYLVSQELSKIEQEIMREIEGEDEAEIMKLLRHEAGHAFNYAYQLYKTSEWRRLFGKISQPYSDHYRPNPFSKKFVKHLDHWYAQKHPDDDFAETFAVWLPPGSDWSSSYKGWAAYKKLEYVEKIVKKIGARIPKIQTVSYDIPVEEMDITLEDYYTKKLEEWAHELPERFDADLSEIFPHKEGDGMNAEDFIRLKQTELVNIISNWTGEKKHHIRRLLRQLIQRAKELHRAVPHQNEDGVYRHLLAYATTLTMNYRYLGRFFIY